MMLYKACDLRMVRNPQCWGRHPHGDHLCHDQHMMKPVEPETSCGGSFKASETRLAGIVIGKVKGWVGCTGGVGVSNKLVDDEA